MLKNKMSQEQIRVIVPVLVGVGGSVVVFGWKHSFEISLVPILLGVTIALSVFKAGQSHKQRSMTRSAAVLLKYFEAVGQKFETGETLKKAAIEEAEHITDRQINEAISEFLAHEASPDTEPHLSESEAETEIYTLFRFGFEHPLSAEFKQNYAEACLRFRDFVEATDTRKQKILNALDYVFVATAGVVMLLLMAMIFRAAL